MQFGDLILFPGVDRVLAKSLALLFAFHILHDCLAHEPVRGRTLPAVAVLRDVRTAEMRLPTRADIDAFQHGKIGLGASR
jgi:hypothetical protein